MERKIATLINDLRKTNSLQIKKELVTIFSKLSGNYDEWRLKNGIKIRWHSSLIDKNSDFDGFLHLEKKVECGHGQCPELLYFDNPCRDCPGYFFQEASPEEVIEGIIETLNEKLDSARAENARFENIKTKIISYITSLVEEGKNKEEKI